MKTKCYIFLAIFLLLISCTPHKSEDDCAGMLKEPRFDFKELENTDYTISYSTSGSWLLSYDLVIFSNGSYQYTQRIPYQNHDPTNLTVRNGQFSKEEVKNILSVLESAKFNYMEDDYSECRTIEDIVVRKISIAYDKKNISTIILSDREPDEMSIIDNYFLNLVHEKFEVTIE